MRHDPTFDEKIAWLRQVLDWKDTVADSSEWLVGVQGKPLHRRDLRADAAGQGDRPAARRDAGGLRLLPCTPTSAIAAAARKVDGQMVPLNYRLANGQQVEIVAAKQGGPSRDWLNPELGYVHSNRARAKVRQWFKAQQHEETVAQGRALVERELARLGRTALKLDAVAAKAGFDKTDEFFAAFARDDINSKQVQTAILARRAARRRPQPAPPSRKSRCARAAPRARAAASSSSASIAC